MKKLSFFLLSLLTLGTSGYSECCPTMGCKVFIDAEWLYWKPVQTGMTYALSFPNTDNILGASNEELQQKFKWASGFRVGAGVDFCPRPFDAAFYWTRFHNTVRTTSFEPFMIANQFLSNDTPILIGGSGVPGTGPAVSRWRLRLDLFELDLGYKIVGCDCFLHPFLGVIGGHIHQLQTIRYERFLDTNTSLLVNATALLRNDFDGVGPKLGADGGFHVWNGLQVVGSAATSFLYGRARNPVVTQVLDDPVSFPIPTVTVKYHQQRLIPYLQGKVGLAWSRDCGCFGVDIAAFYEAGYFIGTWRNQSSQIQNIFIADAGYGNLMTQGLTLQADISF